MADSFRARHVGAGHTIQIRSEPHRATMALDYLGQRIRCGRMARRFGPILMVCREFRQLQQDLWLARRDHRLHDLDLDLDYRRSDRCQAQCGDGTSDSPREHHRATKAARETRGENGRYSRGGTGVTCRMRAIRRPLPRSSQPRLYSTSATAADLSLVSHPGMSRVGRPFEPAWLDAATGRGRSPRLRASVPSGCDAGTLSLA